MTSYELREAAESLYQDADLIVDRALTRGAWAAGEQDEVSCLQDAAHWVSVAAGQLYEAEQKKWGAS